MLNTKIGATTDSRCCALSKLLSVCTLGSSLWFNSQKFTIHLIHEVVFWIFFIRIMFVIPFFNCRNSVLVEIFLNTCWIPISFSSKECKEEFKSLMSHLLKNLINWNICNSQHVISVLYVHMLSYLKIEVCWFWMHWIELQHFHLLQFWYQYIPQMSVLILRKKSNVSFHFFVTICRVMYFL